MTEDFSLEALRDRLQSTMDEKGYSMRKLGLASGLSETTVHGILKLGRDPRVGTLSKLCTTLDVSMAWVLFGPED